MTPPIVSLSHHEILLLLIQLSLLLLSARLLGVLFQKVGQPSVVGEILAGILLGPSCLGALSPTLAHWVIPQTSAQSHLLEVVSLLGVMFLLLLTGLEIDFRLIKRHIRSAFGIATGGLLLPLVMGYGLGMSLPNDMMGEVGHRTAFALFLAICMSISALPVIAKVLMELKMTRLSLGQLIIAAAMIDDAVGWILLSVVVGLVRGSSDGGSPLLSALFSVVILVGTSMSIGRWGVSKLLDLITEKMNGQGMMLSAIVVLMFGWGAFSHALHLEPMLGAFMLGIVLSFMPRLESGVVHTLEDVALRVFAPIFFSLAGLKVELGALLNPRLALLATVALAIAVVCKIAGVYIGARVIGGVSHWSALFYGAGLNARGSMGIVVATIGLSLGILSPAMFTIIVLIAIVTSLMAPAALRMAMSRITLEHDELERLRREELDKNALLSNIDRVLVPLRFRAARREMTNPRLEASILEKVSHSRQLSITLLTAVSKTEELVANEFLDEIAMMFPYHKVSKRVVITEEPGDAILDEAKKGFDLILMGTPENTAGSSTFVFTPLIDYVTRLAPCPVLLVQGKRFDLAGAPSRILVPTNGSLASRRAAEVGFSLAQRDNGKVYVLKVVESGHEYQNEELLERQVTFGSEIVEDLKGMGDLFGVQTTGEVQVGRDPEKVIIEAAESKKIDLIVLGTNVRAGSEKLYLGPRVERILHHAPCSVLVVNG